MAKAAVPAKQETKPNLPAKISDDQEFGEFAGAGLENVGARDVLIPRLAILQALSPQINKTKPEFIEGAKQGEICNTASGWIGDKSIFLPVYYRKDFIEWAPRKTGKGLVRIHPSIDILEKCTADEKGKWYTKEGNLIQETAQFYGFNLSEGGTRCFIPMAVTQLKRAKKWMYMATSEKLRRSDNSEFTPPLFYRSYELTVGETGNNEGSWFTWLVERGEALPKLPAELVGGDWRKLRANAIEFQKSIAAGEVRADMAPETEDGGEKDDPADPAKQRM